MSYDGPKFASLAAMPVRRSIALALLTATAAHAQAQPRRPGADRQTVVQLAYALGEAHALRRLCAGAGDATWYARMQRLEAAEGGDETGRRQLVDAFNAGFAGREAEFPACSRRSRTAEQAVAARGRILAARLADAPAADEEAPPR